MSYFLVILAWALTFAAGYRLCLARNPNIQPTKLQRAFCSAVMARHRIRISMVCDESYFAGFDSGVDYARRSFRKSLN